MAYLVKYSYDMDDIVDDIKVKPEIKSILKNASGIILKKEHYDLETRIATNYTVFDTEENRLLLKQQVSSVTANPFKDGVVVFSKEEHEASAEELSFISSL